jgi:hypothetical protein
MFKKFTAILFTLLSVGFSLNHAQILFTATLNGNNEVPSTTTKGTGTAWAVLNPDMTSLTFHITYAQLDSTFTHSHFHIGTSGTSGGVIFPLDSYFNGNTAAGTWNNIPDSVLARLLKGEIYVNVHSMAYPNGEIRGQLYPVKGIGFTAMLDGAQEGSVTTTATGTAWAVLSDKGSKLKYSVTYAGLTSDFKAAHFHLGKIGVAGGVVHPITFTDSSATGTWDGFPDSLIIHLLNGELYVNVHSTNYPNGEIRGQVVHQGEISFNASLDGSQETPPVTTNGTGTGWVVLNSDLKSLSYDLTYANLDSTFAAGHIHAGAAGVPGGVVKPLTFINNNSNGTWNSFPDSILMHLIKEDLYFNVHSKKNPNGEIRGQIQLNNGIGFTAHLNAGQVSTSDTSNGTGTGWFNYANDSLKYRITIAGLTSSLSAAHFHNAPAGSNGGVIQPISFTDSTVNSDWPDIANSNLTELFKGNTYVNVHSSNYPNGEIRGQVLFTNGISGNLPVELISFNASVKENSVKLTWATATESNNQGFEIERSINIRSGFVRIGYVKGNGTSSDLHSYKFTDKNVKSSATYYYRLKQTNFDGTFEYSKVINIASGVIQKFELAQNFPNPFNPSTIISFNLPEKASVSLKIYNILGEEVATLLNETKGPGSYKITFSGANLASGIYFYKLTTNTGIAAVKKMTLLK